MWYKLHTLPLMHGFQGLLCSLPGWVDSSSGSAHGSSSGLRSAGRSPSSTPREERGGPGLSPLGPAAGLDSSAALHRGPASPSHKFGDAGGQLNGGEDWYLSSLLF